MACRDLIGFRAAWAHCPVDSLPSGCPELVEAVADHGAGCVDLPLFPNLVNSPPDRSLCVLRWLGARLVHRRGRVHPRDSRG